MTSLEKKKKNLKGKKDKKQEDKGEVLERVMGSIEMAGASLDFFESSGDEEETLEAATIENEESEEVLEASDNNEDILEASSMDEEDTELVAASMDEESEEMEASQQEDDSELQMLSDEDSDEEEGENLNLLEEEAEPAEFVDQAQAYSIIESLLFSSDRPMGLGTFKQVFKGTNIKSKDIKKALETMLSFYAEPQRGVTLEEINGGWQLRTKVDNMDFLRKLAKARPFKLSGPALEVLSIVAYKQPIVKSEVDEIRGVESGHLLRALMEKHLVCFQGKSELPGKPMQYGTTRKFLEIFGLRNLKELPSLDEIDQLLPEGIGEDEDDEKLSDVTASMSEDYQGNYSEGEDELLKITDTLSTIDTSSEFFEDEKKRQKEKRDKDRAQDIREALDVGEAVDEKERKWLIRYEEKLAAAVAANLEEEPMEALNIENELSQLTEENELKVEAPHQLEVVGGTDYDDDDDYEDDEDYDDDEDLDDEDSADDEFSDDDDYEYDEDEDEDYSDDDDE